MSNNEKLGGDTLKELMGEEGNLLGNKVKKSAGEELANYQQKSFFKVQVEKIVRVIPAMSDSEKILRLAASILFSFLLSVFIWFYLPFILQSLLPPMNHSWRETFSHYFAVFAGLIICFFTINHSFKKKKDSKNRVKIGRKIVFVIALSCLVYVFFVSIIETAPLYAFIYGVFTILCLYLFGETVRQYLIERKFIKSDSKAK